MKLDFWYDFSSPFAYLGATQVQAVAARHGAELTWRPMLLGALFRSVGTAIVPLFEQSRAKQAYLAQDIRLWAAHLDVPFRWPSRFPMRTVTALRLALLAGDRIAPLSLALFRAYWVEDRDIDDAVTLRSVLVAAGLDPELLERTGEDAVKERLRAETDAAARAGVFGAPTFVLHQPEGPLLFWGQDRIELVERALDGWRPRSG